MNTNTETAATVETAAGPVIARAPWIPTIKPGSYHATITEAAVKRNHNGKLHVALQADTGSRIISHEMFMSTEASMANTAKQLKNSFGIESFKDVPSIVGKTCSLRIEHEEYNGKIQAKVRYVNPDNSTEVEVDELANLDAAFKPATALDVAF